MMDGVESPMLSPESLFSSGISFLRSPVSEGRPASPPVAAAPPVSVVQAMLEWSSQLGHVSPSLMMVSGWGTSSSTPSSTDGRAWKGV